MSNLDELRKTVRLAVLPVTTNEDAQKITDIIMYYFEGTLEQETLKARIYERSKIRSIFDTFEWEPTGTSFDEHASRRTPGDINWAMGKNSDFALSAMQAQSRIDNYIEENPITNNKSKE